jgi:hypothetical protein
MATKWIIKNLRSLKKGPYIHDTNAWQHTGSLFHVHFYSFSLHSSAPVSTGNTFQDLPRLRETAGNTERYI